MFHQDKNWVGSSSAYFKGTEEGKTLTPEPEVAVRCKKP